MHQEPDARINEIERSLEALMRRIDQLSVRVLHLEQPGINADSEPKTDTDPSRPQGTQTPSAPSAPIAPVSSPSRPPVETKRIAKPVPARVSKPIPKKRGFELDPSKFEWVLGIRGLMLLGVVIVIVGVGMFLKLAHDEGWIGAMSPIAKCAGAGVFGIMLVALGELLRKKLNPLASSGFTAAGIATLFASAYAASRVYDLLGVELAFGLLAMITAGGVVLGAIGQRVMLSLLSLIGAFAVPVLLSTGEPSYFVFPAYLLLLLSMGAVLSGWKGGRYAYARQLAWWGTGLLGSAWIVDMHDRALVSSLVFVTLAWLMTVIELACSARFFTRLRDRVAWDGASNAGIRIDAEGNRSFNPAGLLTREARWINALFGATIWAVVSAGATIRAQDPGLVFLSPMGFAVMGVVVVIVTMRIGNIRRISSAKDNASPLSLFLSAVVVNCSLLLVASIATGLGGWLEVIAWLSVGLGAIETGRRLRFRAVGLFGSAMIAFAILRLFTFDLRNAMSDGTHVGVMGVFVGAWGVQVLAAALACAGACWRSRYRPEQLVAGSVALWLIALCVLNDPSDHGRMGLYWALLGAGAIWALRARVFAHLRDVVAINAIVLLGLGTCIGVFTQFNDPSGVINPIEVGVLALAWGAFAALPGALYAHRAIGAGVIVSLVLIALGRVGQDHGMTRMLVIDALAIALVSIASRWLWRWSLIELAGALVIVLACAWALEELRQGTEALTQVPMVTDGSITSFIVLVTMLSIGIAIIRVRVASDAIGDVRAFRLSLRSALLAGAWLLALIVSSLEIVRFMHQWFDSSSAQGAGVSIWWSVFAVASVATGFRVAKALRWAGLTLLCIVAGKVLLIDTVTLAPTGRIVASITVGLIIIATGVLYTWLVKQFEGAESPGSLGFGGDA